METRQMRVTYYENKDILYLQVLPERPAKIDETRYGFMVRYDWDDLEKIVGFECLDFSLLIPHLAEKGVLPEIEMKFDVEDSDLKDSTLKEILIWAYQQYVLKRPTVGEEPVISIRPGEKVPA